MGRLVLVLVAVAALLPAVPAVAADTLQIVQLAVGQNDAALFVGPCGEVGMVDAGAGARDEVLGWLDARNARGRLKWGAVSHYDQDHVRDMEHVGGAAGVGLEAVYDRGGDRTVKDSDTYRSYYDWVTAAGIRRPVDIGAVFALCAGAQQVTFTVVSAGTDGTAADGVAVSEENDRGLCLHVEYGQFDMATCGDINGSNEGARTDVESAVADDIGDVEVAKVNHHGSRFSSNTTYTSTLSAQAAIISVGANSHGHPTGEAISRLNLAGTALFQTQSPNGAVVDGDVTVTVQGDLVAISTSGRPHHLRFRVDEAGGHAGHDGVARHAGADRIATAIAVSQAAFPRADTVVLARAGDFPDALSGAPLAASLAAPVLLTAQSALVDEIAGEIRRLNPHTIVLLGGTAALSPAVEDRARQLAPTVARIGGANRWETAALIAKQTSGGTTDVAYLAAGDNFPDAVSVSGLAAMQHRPILLTGPHDVPDATMRAVADLKVNTVIPVGGPAAIGEAALDELRAAGVAVAGRLAGANRFETSHAVGQASIAAGGSPDHVWIATGGAFPDALSAGPAVAATGGILALSPTDSMDIDGTTRDAAGLLETLGCRIRSVSLVGGPAALTDNVQAQADRSRDGTCDPPAADNGARAAPLAITQIVADPDGDDVAFDGGEYIAVRNDGTSAVSMDGWTVRDQAGHVLAWCPITVNPGQTARLYTGPGNDGADHCHAGRGTAVWNNTGDTAQLIAPDGTIVDTFSY
ncbi:MAG: cell wall-binding repeat-containing protein [Actinobacteria bacterium]|nr:cell wall-binding repeat-containing protein [Actinomycetota bacterium]